MAGSILAKLARQAEAATLPTGEVVLVRAFTIEQIDMMDVLEPDALSAREYARLRLFMVLVDAPGFELSGATLAEKYASWKIACDAEVMQGLEEVLRAVERVNATFRHRLPRQPGPQPGAPPVGGTGDPTVGSGTHDAPPA